MKRYGIITAPPASGKTYFVQQNKGTKDGYKLYDSNNFKGGYMAKVTRNGGTFLEHINAPDKSILLANAQRTYKNTKEIKIFTSSVIIPKDTHLKYIEKRSKGEWDTQVHKKIRESFEDSNTQTTFESFNKAFEYIKRKIQ